MPGGHCTLRGKNRGQDASRCYADANFLNGILAAADDVFFQLYWIEISLQKMLERLLDGSEREKATIRALPTSSERKCTGHSIGSFLAKQMTSSLRSSLKGSLSITGKVQGPKVNDLAMTHTRSIRLVPISIGSKKKAT